jgi:ketosteroid isomerase-like protein
MLRFSVLIFFFLSACLQPKTNQVEAIHAILNQQAMAWNEGDIPNYMKGYWESDSLRFSSGSEITYGYHATLVRYQTKYSNKEIMGTLTFDDLKTEPLSETSAFTTGSWHLKRLNGDLNGRFTLIWRKINGNWRIVADHSS